MKLGCLFANEYGRSTKLAETDAQASNSGYKRKTHAARMR